MTSKTENLQLKYFICGGVAGAVSRTCTAPFDRLKVLIQNQTYPNPIPFKDVYLKALRKIYLDGGISSFWRGNTLSIIKIFPESAVKFSCFETFKTALAKDKEDLSASHRFVAGGGAGLISQLIIYPIETVKTRLMSQLSVNTPLQKSHSSIPGIITSLWTENGPRAFYRGSIPALIGIIPYAGVDLMVFETLKESYKKSHEGTRHIPTQWIITFGMSSGACGAIMMYPLSLIRTRMQAQGTPSHPAHYKSTYDAVAKTYLREGVRGFYKGLAPTLAKVLPAISLSYVVYEHSKRAMHIP